MIRKWLWVHSLRPVVGLGVDDDVIFEKLRATFPEDWLNQETSISETKTVMAFCGMASMAGPIREFFKGVQDGQ